MGRWLIAAVAVAGCDRDSLDPLRIADNDDAVLGFVPDPDVGGGTDFACSLRTQNCPAGEKCMPTNEDGGVWDAWHCLPVEADPRAPGQTCTLGEPPWSGRDDCERGAMCWNVDPGTQQRTCIAIHTGSANHQICPDPMDVPMEWANGVFLPCLARCNPLAPQCALGEGCYAVMSWRADFVCMPDATQERGQASDPCEVVNACDPGLACIEGAHVPGCEAKLACCSPFCDLDDPECPAGTDCHPWDPPVIVPGQESVGICRV